MGVRGEKGKNRNLAILSSGILLTAKFNETKTKLIQSIISSYKEIFRKKVFRVLFIMKMSELQYKKRRVCTYLNPLK